MRELNDLKLMSDELDSKELSGTFILSNSATQQLSNSATQQLSNSATQANNFVLISLKKIFFYTGLLIALSGCSLDANIQSLSQLIDVENLNRKDPDFIYGEVVTSGHYQMTGVFGEISEKTQSINNSQWEFEGVFYE